VFPAPIRSAALVAGASALLLLTGCASIQQPEVEHVATAFENPSEDAEARCDLLLPSARAALEERESAPCSEAIGSLPLPGGQVRSTQVWGGQAQVRLEGGDTVFLTETKSGWRVVAAACTPRPEAPYDCQVEAP
jgi:hypothetical protein